MKVELEGLADLARDFQAMGGPPPDPASCPSPETLLAGVRGELTPEALRDVLDHTAICPPCAEDWRLAATFEREAGAADAADAADADTAAVPRPAPRSFRSWSVYRMTAAAAAVLVLAILPFVLHLQSSSPTRGSQARVTSPLDAEQPLPRSDCRLRWDFPETATYDLEVFGPNGKPLFQKPGLTGLEYRVPEESLAKVDPGVPIVWQVTAHLRTGGTTSSKFPLLVE